MKMSKFTISFVLLFCFWSCLLVMIIASSLPYNTIENKFHMSKIIFAPLPQGWAFFTRNPREAQLQLFVKDGKEWKPLNHYHSNRLSYDGLSRVSTKQLMQLSNIFNKIPEDRYINCDSSNFQINKIGCVPNTSYQVNNDFDEANLCGEYILCCQKIIPWAWIKHLENINMPSKIIKINIKCK